MFKLSGCPKCHGDIYYGQDIHGSYLACIQCGRYYAMFEEPARSRRAGQTEPAAGPPVLSELQLAA